MGQLEDALREAALSRVNREQASNWMAELQSRIDETEDGRRLSKAKEEVASLRVVVSQAETYAREQTYAAFAATSNKKPARGASIRMSKRVEWRVNPDKVRDWALENAPILLDLGAAAFDRMVEVGGLVPETIAKVVEDPHVALARDLSSWLTEEAEGDDA